MASAISVWGICLVDSKIEMKIESLMREYVFPPISALIAEDFQVNYHNFKNLNFKNITSIATFLSLFFSLLSHCSIITAIKTLGQSVQQTGRWEIYMYLRSFSGIAMLAKKSSFYIACL